MKRERVLSKNTRREKIPHLLLAVNVLVFLAFSSGCGNKFFDPTQVGRFRPTPAVNVILDSLGVAEETPLAWEEADEPRAADAIDMEGDYTFRSGDIVRVSIFELLQERQQYVNDYVVTETGKISIPDVGVVQAAGITETQLEEEIRQILAPSILKEPSVVVTLLSSQQRTFSVLGDGVSVPGRYAIPRYGFRLADALATAGGPRQFNVSYIYVTRREKTQELQPGRTEPGLDLIQPKRSGGSEKEMLELIAPRAQRGQRMKSQVVVASAELATDKELGGKTTPNGDVGSLGSGKGDWPSSLNKSNTSRPGSNTTKPSGADSVSARDILKSLSQPDTGIVQTQTDSGATFRNESRRPQSNLTDTSRTGQDVSVDDILKTLSQQPAQRPAQPTTTGQRLRPTTTTQRGVRGGAGQVSVDDILKTLSEEPGQGPAGVQVVDEDVLKSIAEPGAKERPGAPADVAEVLESFEQPAPGKQAGEQVVVEDVNLVRPSTEESVVGGQDRTGRIEWVFKDGKWVPVQVGPPTVTEPVIKIEPQELLVRPAEPKIEPEMDWGRATGSRLIRIPADKLLAGDPRYNIVIQSGDTIHVPVDIIGEFCIMGNVNNQGYINVTGRPMTLKMAVAAAGGLGPLAMPKRCEVIRRIGKKKEEIVMVDLDKIANGEQPDFFIKPNDLINVGTDATARWRAVLRNAFRATYGFGFVYDRNFADRDYGGSPLPF
jgi:protein involved in polysaccharide export with SLBB domain